MTNEKFNYKQNEDTIEFWAAKALSKPLLSKVEVIEIAKIIQSTPEGTAKYNKYVNKLVEHNLRLVMKYVHNYIQKNTKLNWNSPEIVDYFQAATFGLIKAAKKFDPQKGYEFSTYACHWMRNCVGRHHMRQSTCIYMPEDACRRVFFFKKHGKPMNEKNGKPRSLEATTQLVERFEFARNWVSLNIKVNNNDTELMSMLESPSIEPGKDVNSFPESINVTLLAAGLSDQQIFILESLYVNDHLPCQIMESLACSRDRYDYLKSQAFKKIKPFLKKHRYTD